MCRSYSFDLHEQIDWKLAEVRVHGGRDRRTEREKRSPARRHVEKANGASQALKRVGLKFAGNTKSRFLPDSLCSLGSLSRFSGV
jgi:hypothetical protein